MALRAFLREISGKKVKKLRREGKIPAVLYGPQTSPKNIFVEKKEFFDFLKKYGTEKFLTLILEDKEIPVLIKEIQKDYLYDEILHLDFYQLPEDKPIEAEIPLEFVGEAPAKEKGAIILKQLKEIPVKALPSNLPKSIKVDLSLLKEIDDRILVKDLNFPEGVKPLIEKDLIVVLASTPEEEEEAQPETETSS